MRGGSVAVVGGSIAGCAAALAAVRGGAEEVTVFERTRGELQERGVGLTLQSDRFAELEADGYVDTSMPWSQLERRVWTVQDPGVDFGRQLSVQSFPFRAYGWGSLWSELRRRVPKSVDFRSGTAVTGVEAEADGVTLELENGQRERFDAVVGADGYRSVVREAMFPGLLPQYAGYLGWRGTSPWPAELEGEGAGGAATAEARNVVFPGGHCMIYRIPDRSGGHRFNWVLYTVPPKDPGQPDPNTPGSLPPGQLTSTLTDSLRSLVAEHFPPFWAECLLRTPAEESFVQHIYDLEVPHYATGRLLLAGDAATVARPHTGGGGAKALQDAQVLERCWRAADSWRELTVSYDADRTASGAALVDLGRRMGDAQVTNAPDWKAMGSSEFDAWWDRQNGGSDRHSGFGGQALNRA